MAKKKKSDNKPETVTKAPRRWVPIVLVAVAVFVATCFITQNTGIFGKLLGRFLLGCFSVGGYLIPVLLVLHAVFYFSDVRQKRIASRIVFSVLLVIVTASIAHAIYTVKAGIEFNAAEFYALGTESRGGGFIGGLVAFSLLTVVDYIGFIILAITFIALYVAYFLVREDSTLGQSGKRLFRRIIFALARAEIKRSARKLARKKRKAERKLHKKATKTAKQIAAKQGKALRQKKNATPRISSAKATNLYDDDFFAVDNGLSELKIEELGINETRNKEDVEKNPTFQEKVFPGNNTERKEHRFTSDFGFEEKPKESNVKEGDIIIETEPPREQYRSSTSEEDAESFFSKGFTPFDFEMNQRLAAKQSSRATQMRGAAGVREFAEPVARAFTAEELERAKRISEFEEKKHQLINEAKLRREKEEHEAAERKKNSEVIDIAALLGEEAENIEKIDTPMAENTNYTVPVSEKNTETDTEAFTIEIKNSILNAEENECSQPVNLHTDAVGINQPVPEFKPYTPPAEAKYAEEKAESDTLTVSRSPIFEEPEIKIEPVVSEPVPAATPKDTEKSTEFVFDDFNRENGSVLLDGFTAPVGASIPILDFDEFDEEEDTEEKMPLDSVYTEEAEEEEESGVSFEFGEEIPVEKQNPDVSRYRQMFDIFADDDKKDDGKNEILDDDDDFKGGDVDAYELDDVDEPPFEIEIPKPVTKPAPKPAKPAAEADNYEKPDYSAFKFPPIDLLAKGTDTEDPSISEETNETGARLIDALLQFDVRASIMGVDRGPRITRYEVVPARGVRVSKVIGLFDDIALNLAAEGIRMEAPIPGKSAIGVEIPNKHPSTVMLRDLIESEEFTRESSKTFACVGKDVTGNPIFGDIAKMPHILVAGATGMGKSVCINSILVSILYKARPDEVKFIMIDPKTVEFTMYNGIPHLLIPVVTDVKQAAGALMWAIDEMNKRYELMAKHEVRKLDSYNDLVRANPELGQPLPKIIIVVDELNDLMQQVRKPVEGLITNITQKARAAGIHMIIGTQRPSVDVITGVIKANIPSRISCKVTALTDSRTILDQAGAEKLLDKGDMLFAPVGKPKPIRVQGAFVSDNEVEKIMKFLKSNVKGSVYDQQALEEINRAAQKCNRGKDDDDFDDEDESEDGVGYLNDKQFLESVDLAIRQGKISTSLIQRKISIGYGKAAKFIDIMEDMGIVSEPNGQKPRDVLITRDEWNEMLSRRSLDD